MNQMKPELKRELFHHIIDNGIDYQRLQSIKNNVTTRALLDMSAHEFISELHEFITTDSECVAMINVLSDAIELDKLQNRQTF